MTNRQNCYNRCVETVSDRCIKYTGVDVPILGIYTGDSLSIVEQSLIAYLSSTLDGSGIVINLNDLNICTTVQNYLPEQEPFTGFVLNDILAALLQASCAIQSQMATYNNATNASINTLATTFANANSAMASLITTVSATMDSDRSYTEALVETEMSARVTAYEAIASLITTVSARMDTDRASTAALVKSEQTSRATADSAIAKRIDTVSATMATNKTATDAAINSISTAYVTVNGALATRINSVSAKMDTDKAFVTALIVDESVARTNALQAVATKISGVESAFTTANGLTMTAATNAQLVANAAAAAASSANLLLADISSDSKLTSGEKQLIKKEWDIIVSEKPKNDAQADLFTVSKTAYGTAYANLNTYITPLISDLTTTSDIAGITFRSTFKSYYDARTDILNAISSKAKSLADAAMDSAATANAAVLAEITTRANADSAISSRIDTVSATVDTNNIEVKALITSEAEARANADNAMSSRIDTVSASIASPTAEINAAVTLATNAAVTREQAIASSVNTVSAKVDENEAKITTAQTAIVNINGQMSANYNLSVDVNGKIAGMKLGSNGLTSDIIFTADSFKIFNGTASVAPFEVVNDKVVLDTIITRGTDEPYGTVGWNGLSLNNGNDNALKFRHENGVLGMEIGIVGGVLTMRWYNTLGELVWEGGKEGIVYMVTAASLDLETMQLVSNQASNITDLTTLKSDLLPFTTTSTLVPSAPTVYYFNPGPIGGSSPEESLRGYHTLNDKNSAFIPNGWYAKKETISKTTRNFLSGNYRQYYTYYTVVVGYYTNGVLGITKSIAYDLFVRQEFETTCLLEGTKITLFDGSVKNVEDLIISDKLRSLEIEGLLQDESNNETWISSDLNLSNCEVNVIKCEPSVTQSVISINIGLLTTSNSHVHVVKKDGQWKLCRAFELVVGDYLVNEFGEELEITRLDTLNGEFRIYDLGVEDNDLYIANGILTHNK